MNYQKTGVIISLLVTTSCCLINGCSGEFKAKAEIGIIPQPVKVIEKEGEFVLANHTVIVAGGEAKKTGEQLKEMLSSPTGYEFSVKSKAGSVKSMIELRLDDALDQLETEGYMLNVTGDKVVITAATEAGLYYGCQTLRQLLPPEIFAKQKIEGVTWNIPCVEIEDKPLFKWRGMMLDCSRQFFDVDFVKSYIDNLAMHKINVFHWHLTDDDGWRIEIKGYPKLTELGAWRGANEVLPPSYGSGAERYGGFYSQQQIKDVVEYAKQRHIDILPEIDVPGHSKALAASYPEVLCAGNDTSKSVQGVTKNVLCAGRDENFEMLDAILSQVKELFPFDYIHIGGDEVNQGPWSNCPRCKKLMQDKGFGKIEQIQSYFVRRVEDIVVGHGKKMIGWNEILHGGELDRGTAIMSWTGTEPGIEAVKKGRAVVMTPASYFYLDMAQAPGERGHSWVGLINTEKVYSYRPLDSEMPADKLKNILGVQSNLWAEYLDRPPGQANFQTYPRLCALAEVGWTDDGLRKWEEFNDRLGQKHLPRLAQLGIRFRIPMPKAIDDKGKVTVIPPYEDAEVRYTTDGSDPVKSSSLWETVAHVKDVKKLRTRTFVGDLGSRTRVGADRLATTNWIPKMVSEEFKDVEFDVTDGIESSGVWLLDFIYKEGAHKIEIKKVELLEDGKVIAVDEHEGAAGSKHVNNQYRLFVENYNSVSKYVVRAHIRSHGGNDSYGDLVLEKTEQ